MAATRGKRKKGQRPQRKREPRPVEWEPMTKLGRMVRKGEITTMSDA